MELRAKISEFLDFVKSRRDAPAQLHPDPEADAVLREIQDYQKKLELGQMVASFLSEPFWGVMVRHMDELERQAFQAFKEKPEEQARAYSEVLDTLRALAAFPVVVREAGLEAAAKLRSLEEDGRLHLAAELLAEGKGLAQEAEDA